jgi:hypothetical protein
MVSNRKYIEDLTYSPSTWNIESGLPSGLIALIIEQIIIYFESLLNRGPKKDSVINSKLVVSKMGPK